MKDEPLEAVYAFVERAYIRLQAGDMLMRCIETGSPGPMHLLVEGLVVAGPQSLSALREMLAESGLRKLQLLDDLNQILYDFESALHSYGVSLPNLKSAYTVSRLSSDYFLGELTKLGVIDAEIQGTCLQIMRDSRGLIRSLVENIKLLEDIEDYIQDWLWGLAVQSSRQKAEDSLRLVSRFL